MEFELKNYKVLKIKSYLKKNKIVFFYAAASLNLKNWILIEQVLKKSNLNYYRLLNTLAKNTLKKSIYKNYRQLIHSLTMLVNTETTTKLKLKTLINLEIVLTLLSIKLNNKIYSVSQLTKLIYLSYKTSILLLLQSLNAQLMLCFKIQIEW